MFIAVRKYMKKLVAPAEKSDWKWEFLAQSFRKQGDLKGRDAKWVTQIAQIQLV